MFTNYLMKYHRILRAEGFRGSMKSFIKLFLSKLDPEYNFQFKFYTSINNLINSIRYSALSNPYKTIMINPTNIDYRLRKHNDSMVIAQAKYRGIGRIRGGDWDTYYKSIEDTSDGRGCIIKGFRQRFESGMSWEKTDHYCHVKEKYEKKKYGNFNSLEEAVQKRMESNELLYNKILENGYRSNHQSKPIRPGVSEPIESRLEVLVVIGRGGDIYLFGGYHRFSIARVLDIEIPVQVVCRHKKWQNIRDEIYKNGLTEEYLHLEDHPDLKDVLN